MSILDRYIASILARGFISALAALVAIFSVLTFTDELRGSGADVRRVISFVLMTLPAQAHSLFPASALIGTVMGLGQLMRNHELVALEAAGISRVRLSASVLMLAVSIALAGIALGELVAAPLSQRAHQQRALAESGGRMLSTTAGLWLRDGARFVNIGEVRADGSFGNVNVFDFDDVHTLRRFVRAEAATRVDDHWVLANVQESILHADGAITQRAASQEWDAPFEASRLRTLWLQPEDIPAAELYRTIGWLQRHQQNPLRYELAFWRRISAPLYTVIMVMLAVPIALMAGPRARIGEFVVRGAVVGIGFQMLQQTFTNIGLVAGFPPLLTASTPAIAALVAFAILFRVHVAEA